MVTQSLAAKRHKFFVFRRAALTRCGGSHASRDYNEEERHTSTHLPTVGSGLAPTGSHASQVFGAVIANGEVLLPLMPIRSFKQKTRHQAGSFVKWRRGRDSNPRCTYMHA
jgi:hypothetical protein